MTCCVTPLLRTICQADAHMAWSTAESNNNGGGDGNNRGGGGDSGVRDNAGAKVPRGYHE
jgi:hypothetical protein